MLLSHYKYIQEIVQHPYNRSGKARSILRYLSWNVGPRLLNEADYTIELIPGARVILSNAENYATLAYTCRLYDFEDMLFVLHFLRAGDCFGDFGANVGVYSVLAGSRDATVVAVEPVPQTFQKLCTNFRLNQVKGLPKNCGLSDRRQTLAFTTDRGGMNKVAKAAGSDTCEVEVVTVDELIDQAGLSPSLVKIDVEGYEMPLLTGARTLLASDLLAVIIEMNDSGREYGFSDSSVHELLRASGFSPFRYDPFDRRLTTRDGINRSSFNTLYLKDAALAQVRQRVEEAAPIALPLGLV